MAQKQIQHIHILWWNYGTPDTVHVKGWYIDSTRHGAGYGTRGIERSEDDVCIISKRMPKSLATHLGIPAMLGWADCGQIRQEFSTTDVNFFGLESLETDLRHHTADNRTSRNSVIV